MLRAMFGTNNKNGSNPGPNKPKRAGRRFGGWIAVAAAVLVLLVLAGVIAAERKSVAAFLVQSYLARHGVASTIEFDRLSRGGFAARVRVGPETPEFSADILDVTLSYDGIFALPTLGTVRLVHPVLRAGYDGEIISFGSLQPLVDEALAKEPEGPGPSVTVEGGTLVLSTPDGVLQFSVDGAIAQGVLTSLNAKLSPVTLRGAMYDADIAAGALSAKLVNGALDASAEVTLRHAALKEDAATDAQAVTVSAEAKGVQWRKNDGRVAFTAARGTLAARSARVANAKLALADAESRLRFEKLSGSYAEAKLQGTAQIDLVGGAGTMRMATRSATNPSVHVSWASTDFALAGNDWSVGGLLRFVTTASEMRESVAKGEIAVRSPYADFSGNARIASTGADGVLQGSITGVAALPRSVSQELVATLPVVSTDPALHDALIRAMSNVGVKIPRLRVARSNGETSLTLLADAALSSPNNARLTVSPGPGSPGPDSSGTGRPLLALRDGAMDGAFGVHLRGGDLPEIDLAVPSYRATWNAKEIGWNASPRFETKANLAALRGLHLKGVAQIEGRNDRIAFVLPQCADAELAEYRGDKGALLTGGKARMCADAGRPLVVSDKKGWTFASRVSGASARLEQAQSTLSEGSGRITLAGNASAIRGGRIEAERAIVSDALKDVRFRAVTLDGAMDLTGQDWRGMFALTTRGRRFASVAVHHDMGKGSGNAAISAEDIAFDPASFQPGDISPLLSAFATRVRGRARFAGDVRWTPDTLESNGRVRLTNIDFQSRLGQVRQTNGELALTSLIPVTLAPHQTVTMERIDWLVPLEMAKVQFSLSPSEIALDSASADIAGGHIRLDPERFAFASQSTTQGTLHMEHVDPTPLLAAAGLADRIKIQARVQGAVPFTYGPAGLRFANGHIAAEGPGRLSVQREAVTAAVGASGSTAAQPAAVQDFAYQALENLAFDRLTGDVNSLPEGRLGILLHVKGVHDPAEAVETRVGVSELLQGRAFDKPLPLPKGTPIDLTLDTSLNLDELLASYFGMSGSAGVAAPQ
jgi:hypothetical protein